jgi:drug/metabolite transporter (DMT)-like permease
MARGMSNVPKVAAAVPAPDWNWRHLTALLVGNVVLALGPWAVRLADSGPVAAGFWRLALALPFLAVLARADRQKLSGFSRGVWLAVAGAGLFFALDLASWHVAIHATRLANATLFGNAGSIILMVWGLIAIRRLPRWGEWLAFLAAVAGAAILMGRSLEIDAASVEGDLLSLLAGLFYTFYILLLQGARAQLGNWSILFWASAFGAPPLLAFALLLGEPVWPHDWWPLIALMLGSQVVGQGLLVYALRHFSPLVIGLSLMTQPAVAVLAGWFAFGEALTAWDGVGIVLVSLALVLARAGERRD